MKQIFTLLTGSLLLFCGPGKTQIILNELYTDPGAGKHEFFELYNSGASSSPVSVDNYTLVTFFEISGQKGFYVMDLPNLSVGSRGFFVGSAALPFNYQGVTGSTASDFSWNSAAFIANNGYVKMWAPGTANLSDGNLYYDEGSLPANFNDFFYRRTATGASYSIFLYNNGVLINTFIGGSGGNATILNDIVNMPQLYVDMTAASPDFTINFAGYGSLPLENCTQNAGSDNGYIRQADGACGQWVKSSSQFQHTPKASNGTLSGTSGSVSVAAAIARGTLATGSVVNYNVVAGPSSAFPVEMQIYLDNGTVMGKLDAADTYVESNTETIISQGPFYTHFYPYNASILIVVKTSAGCLDKIIYIPNSTVLSVNLISFQGNQDYNKIMLNWSVDQNETADRFELEKSFDGRNFTTAAIVFSTENSGVENYSFKETAPVAGKIIYRLKIFDKNQKAGYSNNLVFQENSVLNSALKIINNPVNDKLVLSFQNNSCQVINIKLVDANGRLVQEQKINGYKGCNIINLTLNSVFKSGIYIVDLFDGINHYSSKFVKQ